MSGQFDDAEEGDDLISLQTTDDEFIHAMRAKMMLLSEKSTLPPANKISRLHENSTPQTDPNPAETEKNPVANNIIAGEEHSQEYYDEEDDDEDLYDLLEDDEEFKTASGHSSKSLSHLSEAGSSRINLSSKNMSHSVSNAVTKMHHLESTKRKSHTGRDDRATSEQCLDPRTRLILFRMLSNGFLELIDGCLSTGKEANVYYAKAGRTAGWATGSAASVDGDGSISHNSRASDVTFAPLVSSDITETGTSTFPGNIGGARDTVGLRKPLHSFILNSFAYSKNLIFLTHFRFSKPKGKSNPRKMVKVWAEKEMRNYRRIYNAKIPCPAPVLLKSHVLIMEFLGENGWPSPRIRDAGLSEKRLREAYVQTIVIMRRMFQRCKLVHGDLSEYNLLWHKNEVYVIDVSQSVESDHPAALDFLRKDAANVNDFFKKAGNLNVMTTRQLFEFVTSTVIEDTPEAESAALDSIMEHVDSNAMLMEKASENERRALDQQESVDEAVFMSQFLPRSLNQVADYDVGKIEVGDVEETYAHAVAALTGNEDVVEAVAKKTGVDVSSKSTHVLFSANVIDGAAWTNDDEDDQNPAEEDSDDENESAELELEDDSSSESGERKFVKVAMTPEEAAALKEEEKARRKANKKAVKEAQSEKRMNKIKKKDKQRAIKKAKGNKKKK
ncbi:hypothetical protein ACHAXS_013490 [Conticribra weissflogii]